MLKRDMAWLVVAAAGIAGPAWAGGGEGYTAVIDGKETPAPALALGEDSVVQALLDEGKTRCQVMSHLKHLTEEIGPRLTGSSRVEQANRWCLEQYEAWGLANPHLEQWGEIPVRFDRGPSSGKVFLKRTSKRDGEEKTEFEELRTLSLTTQSWNWGTNGAVRAKVVKEPKTDAEYDAVKDSLDGAWILIGAPAPVGQRGIRGLVGARYELRQEARRKAEKGTKPEEMSIAERLALRPVAGYLSTSRDERVWTGAVPGWRDLDPAKIPQDTHAIISGPDYDFVNSRVADGEPIEVELDLQHTFTPGPIPVYNTIAEIPGTEWPDQVVIISAHLDSWDGPGSQGCTDNGTGTAVTLEAARMLASVHAKPKRTIRFVHWTGEEQGLLGSKAYVKAHEAELDKVSVMFVDDGGTNYEGGLVVAPEQLDLMAAATAPTNNQFYSEVDKKYLNVNIRTGPAQRMSGGSDHMSFNQAGVPGFFWDEVGRADYGHGWHTQFDKYDLAIEEYLKQSATNAAITAYRLACADTLLPRPAKEATEEPKRPAREGRDRDAKPEGEKPKDAGTGGGATPPKSSNP